MLSTANAFNTAAEREAALMPRYCYPTASTTTGGEAAAGERAAARPAPSSYHATENHHCQYRHPPCGVCGVAGDPLLPAPLADPQEWFAWCTACGHGGHARHLDEWFSRHELCPFPLCPCSCRPLLGPSGASEGPPNAVAVKKKENSAVSSVGNGIPFTRRTVTDAISHVGPYGRAPQLLYPSSSSGSGGVAPHTVSGSSNSNSGAASRAKSGEGQRGGEAPTAGATATSAYAPSQAPPLCSHPLRPVAATMHDGNGEALGGSAWGDVAYYFTEYPAMAAVRR